MEEIPESGQPSFMKRHKEEESWDSLLYVMGFRSTSVHHNRKNCFWRILDFVFEYLGANTEDDQALC